MNDDIKRHRELQFANTYGIITKSIEDELEKGKQVQPIGTKKTFGGREYIKTNEGWKYHGKGTGEKAQAHAEGAKVSSLEEHAKKTAEEKLKKIVTHSKNEELRRAAHKEVARREKFEYPKEEKKKPEVKKEPKQEGQPVKNVNKLEGMDKKAALSEYKDVYSISSAGIDVPYKNIKKIYEMADKMSAKTLAGFIEEKEDAINKKWASITHGTPHYYSASGKAAESKWKGIIKDLHDTLNEKTKGIEVKSKSGAKVTFKNGSLQVDGKKVTRNSEFGYVHLDNGKGKAQQFVPGALYSGKHDLGKNQLQGITYTSIHNQLKNLVLSGADWNEIEAKMKESTGPIHGEKPGSIWNETKKYLGL